jgi:thiol-disulfide isomerase/thioredoxin
MPQNKNILILISILAILLVSCETRPETSVDQTGPVLVIADAEEIRSVIQNSGARLTIVNFWATWCVPCKAEFPDLIKAGMEFEKDGVQVLFVSTDFEDEEEAVLRFLEEQKVPWRSFLKKGDGYEFVQSFFEDWSGALPTTLFFGSDGDLIDYWQGISTYEEVRSKIEATLEG